MAPRLAEMDLVIVDAFSLLFRAFHAFPITLTSPSGELTNAIYGFTRMLLDVLKKIEPQYLVVATDKGEPTFRHQAYVEYKANREEAPHELTQQIDRLYEVLKALNIPTIGLVGYEADDVIGTLARRLREEHPELKVGIFTGDKDAYQLVGGNIFIISPPRKRNEELQIVDEEAVITKMGVSPKQVVDFKALCGDPSDNIPGVKGVGPKSAASLLSQFDSLQRLYAALALSTGQSGEMVGLPLSDEEKQALVSKLEALSPSLVQKLADSQENAWLSQKLAQIDTDVPVDFHLESARLSDYDKATALSLFDELGFSSLKKSLPQDTFESGVQESLF